jgi:predicted aconitase with swiveling domain
MQTFAASGICGTVASGSALVSAVDLSLSLIEPETGIVTQPGHPLRGQSVAGRVLVFPNGSGSSSGSYRLLHLSERGMAPVAIVNDQANAVVVAGAVLASIALVHRLPMPVHTIRNGAFVVVDPEHGLIAVREESI